MRDGRVNRGIRKIPNRDKAVNALKNGDEIVGNRTKATVVKNKVAPPFRRTEFDILYGVGISYEGDVIDLGLQYNLVTKSGAWFSFAHPEKGDIRLGQGREAVRTLLRENPELCEEIADLVREAMNPVTTPAATAAKEQAEAEPAPAKKTTKKKATAKAAAK